MKDMHHVIVEREVPCLVRDGTTLYATIYRPKAKGEFPVLLTRLPYNKNLPEFAHQYVDPIRAALSGYVVIIQDVRGRFASEGNFEPFVQEIHDGYDTVEWAAKLPYANGEVGMFGKSYTGYTQLYAALEQPPSLKALFPVMTGNHLRNRLFGRNSVLDLAASETWVLDSIAPDFLKRRQEQAEYARTLKEIKNDLNEIDKWYAYKPIKEWPPIKKHPELHAFFDAYLNREVGNKVIEKTGNKNDGEKDINLPAYHVPGWYEYIVKT